jgi:hypothetical protein
MSPDTPPQATLALVVPETASPLSLIAKLIDSGKLTAESVGVVERLVALQEHMAEKSAEREFAVAFSALQGELKTFRATREVPTKAGGVKFAYLPYEEIMASVDPLAKRYGFSISFSTDFQDGRIVQTCTLQHIAGHHRDYKAFARAGSGPYGATETQADGAAMTYAKRYALCNALNIVVERDTDARNEGSPISPEQAQTLAEMVKETGSDEVKFLRYAGAKTYEEIGTARYDELFAELQKRLHR